MKKILVVVDMQNDFIDGALGSKEAIAIVPNVATMIKSNEWDQIVVTQDTHFDNYMETQEGKKLPVPHCIEGTDGWEVNKKVMNAALSGSAPLLKIEKITFGSVELPGCWDGPPPEKQRKRLGVYICRTLYRHLCYFKCHAY